MFSFQICANGLVSIGTRSCSAPYSDLGRPFSSRGPSIIAPFWSDIDITRSLGVDDNRVYYRLYENTSLSLNDSKILERIQDYVRYQSTALKFAPQRALVVTWYRVRPWIVSKYLSTTQVETLALFAKFSKLNFN